MFFLGYLGAILTGLSLGLIGGGGSILIVPVLVYLFGIDPSVATGYSLFVVGIASLVGVWKYAQEKLLDLRTAMIFGVPSFVGVFFARSFLIPVIPAEIQLSADLSFSKDALIMFVFAVVMLLASYSMITSKERPPPVDAEKGNHENRLNYRYKWIALEGLGVGAVTGFVGAGGGFLIIPALVLLAGLPMKLAVGTSLLIIAFKSLLGFLGDYHHFAEMNWIFLISIALTAIVGIFVGTFISQFVPGKKLQPAFGWFVLIMGVWILANQFFQFM